jgi:ABC-type nickel/cobalt efflux system permease component RcnA
MLPAWLDLASGPAPSGWPAAGVVGVLGLGLLFGLRHAIETDHIAAVSAIVSERRGWRAAVMTGSAWGAGHSLSIIVAGFLVLGLRLAIPESVARLLEFAVALMIIALGGTALARALRSQARMHSHEHVHDGVVHRHLHFHQADDAHAPSPGGVWEHGEHRIGRAGLKPFLVGAVHGLAGSAALTLLVLAQIASLPLGLAYLALFGLGSIAGMAIMSLALSLPFSAASARPGLHRGLRVATGLLSLGFGLVYAWTQVAATLGA